MSVFCGDLQLSHFILKESWEGGTIIMIILQKRELGLGAEGRCRSKGCRSGIQTHDWKGPRVKAGFQGSQEEDRWLRAETAGSPKSSARERGQKQSWEGAAPQMETG